MADLKNHIVGPTDPAMVFDFNGLPIAMVADLPEGGFVQIVNGANPIGVPVPGPQIRPGGMLVVLPLEICTQIRPHFRKATAEQSKSLSRILGPNGMAHGA